MLLRILALSVAGSAIGATAQDEMAASPAIADPVPASIEEQATADEIAMADVGLLAEAVFVATDVNGDEKVDEKEFVAQGEATAPVPADNDSASVSAAVSRYRSRNTITEGSVSSSQIRSARSAGASVSSAMRSSENRRFSMRSRTSGASRTAVGFIQSDGSERRAHAVHQIQRTRPKSGIGKPRSRFIAGK